MSVLDQVESLVLANFPQHKDVAACFAELGSPSTSIAILDNGEVSARCYSTVGDNVDTVFQAASISKPINGLATLKGIEQGHFTLASTLAELLPKDYLDILTTGTPASQRKIIEKITIKHLLSHTSGLNVSGFAGYGASTVPTLKQILAGEKPSNSPRIRLQAFPGQNFSYSGGGITVLQLILESVVSKDYPTLMNDLVLKPLGMTRSFYAPLPESEGNAAKAHFTGFTKCDLDHYVHPELAAAGLWTTSTDLLKIVQATQKSLAGDGGFLRQDTAKTMLTEIDDGMALSWGVEKDENVFSHTGGNIGFECIAFGFAKLGDEETPMNSGIAVMSNSSNGYEVYRKVLSAVSGIKGWPWPNTSKGLRGAAPLWMAPSEGGGGWEEWKGKWQDETHSYIVGEDEHGCPMVTYEDFGNVRLMPAVNSRRRDDGSCRDFILEGMDMMLSFEEKEDVKTVRLHRRNSGTRELKSEGSDADDKA
jgi:CubicO group peptidase (beta-lactamase class C family)